LLGPDSLDEVSFDNRGRSSEALRLKGLMTPLDLSTGMARALTTIIKMMAAVAGALGVALIGASFAYFFLHPRTAPGFDQSFWVLTCLRVPWPQIVTPLLVLTLGLVLVRTALLPWRRWSADSVEQVIAAVLFFPSLWWVWNVIQVVPGRAWGWKLLGVAAAVFCLAAHRIVSAAICRVLFRGETPPSPVLKVSPAS